MTALSFLIFVFLRFALRWLAQEKRPLEIREDVGPPERPGFGDLESHSSSLSQDFPHLPGAVCNLERNEWCYECSSNILRVNRWGECDRSERGDYPSVVAPTTDWSGSSSSKLWFKIAAACYGLQSYKSERRCSISRIQNWPIFKSNFAAIERDAPQMSPSSCLAFNSTPRHDSFQSPNSHGRRLVARGQGGRLSSLGAGEISSTSIPLPAIPRGFLPLAPVRTPVSACSACSFSLRHEARSIQPGPRFNQVLRPRPSMLSGQPSPSLVIRSSLLFPTTSKFQIQFFPFKEKEKGSVLVAEVSSSVVWKGDGTWKWKTLRILQRNRRRPSTAPGQAWSVYRASSNHFFQSGTGMIARKMPPIAMGRVSGCPSFGESRVVLVGFLNYGSSNGK